MQQGQTATVFAIMIFACDHETYMKVTKVMQFSEFTPWRKWLSVTVYVMGTLIHSVFNGLSWETTQAMYVEETFNNWHCSKLQRNRKRFALRVLSVIWWISTKPTIPNCEEQVALLLILLTFWKQLVAQHDLKYTHTHIYILYVIRDFSLQSSTLKLPHSYAIQNWLFVSSYLLTLV